ncbi:MAG: hypothetical protein BroJett038_01010 [Chloroflexota bacterium]|nr:MAG: hypothetical protein BroJett038_01010 [Chloroflexota bacterium]
MTIAMPAPGRPVTTSSDRQAEKTQSILRRLWLPVWALLAAAAFLLAATGCQHGLPYIDYGDEMTMWTRGRALIDPTWEMYQPEYPPGMVLVAAAVQRVQAALGEVFANPAGAVAATRLISVFAHTGTVALAALLAYRLAAFGLGAGWGMLAGFSAGLFWMVLPLAIFFARTAMPDALLCLWFTASLAAGVEGWIRRSARWLAASFLLALVAAVFKWQGGAAVILPLLGCLTLRRDKPRQAAGLLLVLLAALGAFGYWAVFVHRALEGGVYTPGTTPEPPTVGVLLENLRIQLAGIGPAAIFGLLPAAGLLVAALPAYRRRFYRELPLWVFPVVLLAFLTIISFQGADVFNRHYLAGAALLAALAGVGLALAARAGWQLAARLGRQFYRGAARLALAAVLLAVAVPPTAQMWSGTSRMTAEMLLPDRRAIFAEWARATAVEGPMLVSDSYLVAAVQTLYGYQGRPIETPLNQGTTDYPRVPDITDAMLAEAGIRYLVVRDFEDLSHLTTPLTRLIAYGDGANYRGQTWAAYYVGALPPPLADEVIFGGQIRLWAYSLEPARACPGETLNMRLVWSVVSPPQRYYSFFLHLYSPLTGELSAPINGQQPVSDERPTLSWTKPGEILAAPSFTWALPEDMPPGEYALWLGLFDPVGGERLLLPDGKHYYALPATIRVPDC